MKLLYIFGLIATIGFFAFTLQPDSKQPVVDNSRAIEWSTDIAPILYNNCVKCHHTGGIGLFPLISYNDAFSNRFLIEHAVHHGDMPPWKPDTTYHRFSGERILSLAQIQLIEDWVQAGAPSGDVSLAPNPPTFTTSGPQIGVPDLTLSAPVYQSNAAGLDDYVCFSIPSGMTQNRIIRAVEVEPGNASIVHHALIFIDESGTYQTDTSGTCVGPVTGKLIGEFTPGSFPQVYPGDGNINFGVTMQAGSNIVLAMHYPHGSIGQTDSTKVHLYFYPQGTTNVREVDIEPLVDNWNFCVPANGTQTVTGQFPSGATLIPVKVSMLGLFPHMHLTGNTIESYYLDSNLDTTRLIRINHWDFEWQGFYRYQHMKVIPANGQVHGIATYDNTFANVHAPDPSQPICAGLNTTDEMFLIYYMYTEYESGDEFLNLDSLSGINGLEILQQNNTNFQVYTYPNPASDLVNFNFELSQNEKVILQIFDLSGKLVYAKNYGNKAAGVNQIKWTPNNINSGTYIVDLTAGKDRFSGRVILH